MKDVFEIETRKINGFTEDVLGSEFKVIYEFIKQKRQVIELWWDGIDKKLGVVKNRG